MKIRSHLKLGLLACLFLAAILGCSKPKSETATLEGRWSGFEQGRPDTRLTIKFNNSQFAYWNAQSNEWGRGTFVVNSQVQPPQMDLTFQECPAPDYVGKVGLAIFELQGDELRLAGCEPGSAQRPTDIAGGPGVRTFTLRRK